MANEDSGVTYSLHPQTACKLNTQNGMLLQRKTFMQPYIML